MIKTKTMQIMEQALERFQQGGFINGDYVKVNKKITNSPFYKNLPDQTKDYIQSCIDTDLNLRISALSNHKPGVMPLLGADASGHAAESWVADIFIEYAPGLYKNPLTIPVEFLSLVKSAVDGFGTIETPDSLKKKTEVHSPEKIKKQELPVSNTKIGNSKGPTEVDYSKKDFKSNKSIKESTVEEEIWEAYRNSK